MAESSQSEPPAVEGVLPRAKLTAVSMFTTLATNINNLNLSDYYPRRNPDIVFPPPSWHIEDLEEEKRREGEKKIEETPGETAAEEDKQKPSEESPKDPDSEQKPADEVTKDKPLDLPPTDRDRPENPPEPMTFAQKLRDMIESLPVPPAVASTVTNAITTASESMRSRTGVAPTPAAEPAANKDKSEDQKEDTTDPPLPIIDSDGPPVPEGVDSETLRYLSSQSVMTGTANGAATPSARQTVWAALEKLKPGMWTAKAEEQKEASKDMTPETDEGVMMYAPLRPDDSSEIVLAECIPPSDSQDQQDSQQGKPADKGKGKATDKPKLPDTDKPKLWVPSTTAISIYTTWWGYRLYLPPPVMNALDSNQMKTTKRAAVITTALQWFLGRLPTMIVPPQMRGAIVMLRRLAPLIGYVGVFVAWSWERIKVLDEGNGVVLTATWLLPVALIPTAWDAGDIHGPKLQPEEPTFEAPPANGKGKEKEKKGFVDRLNPFSGWGKK